MIQSHELRDRRQYLDELIKFQDTEPVKIVTGIRRCGKSSLLKLMARHLEQAGIGRGQILEMNFESYELRSMNCDSFYEYVRSRIIPGKRMYLFLDELQRIDGWENAVNSFRVDFDCDIYITGSNAYLLSSEYSTYMSGRYVEIKMLPLSFSEFLDFQELEVREAEGHFGGVKKRIFDEKGQEHDLLEAFDAYMRFGGMPGIADSPLDQQKALTLLDGIYSTVVMRDILDRERRRNKTRITDSVLLQKVVLYLADNIGSNVSALSIGRKLVSEGLLDEGKRRGNPSSHTVQIYVEALVESYFFYGIKRFDIKGKGLLMTLGKYYIVDMGLRNYLLGFRDRDSGHALENVVYLELLRRGYDVAVGKVGDKEVDFIATDTHGKLYIQVTQSMASDDVRQRELEPLRKIDDNYEKMVLSLDTGLESSFEGIKSLNIIQWLLNSKY
jgi:hypothetical protein